MFAIKAVAITTLDELSHLKDEWTALMETADVENVFLTWEWVYTWCKHYLGDSELCTVLFYDERKRLVGIAPCYIDVARLWGPMLRKTIRFLGTEEVCPAYLDFIASRKHKKQVVESFYELIYGELNSKWDVAELSEVPAESLTIDYLSELAERDGKVIGVSDPVASPVINLPRNIGEFLSSLSANERYNLQRKRKRLDSAGTVAWERTSSASAFAKTLDSFIGLHQYRWEGKGEAGAFKRPRFESFHREIGGRFAEQGVCSLDFLKLDGEPIAGIYGYQHKGCYYFYLPGFNHMAVPEASPGTLLLFRCVELAIANGLTHFDLLRGTMPYKLAWANMLRRCLTVRLFNRRLRAALSMLPEVTRCLLKVMLR